MAEQATATAIVPTILDGEYVIEVKDFDAAGKATKLSAPIPKSSNFHEWSLMQRAIMLKKGSWNNSPIPEIIFAITYADSMGLDILQGDVYPTGGGRINTSNKAKIKLALATGNIVGITVDIKKAGPLPKPLKGCDLKEDLECTATIHVKGWQAPIKRTALLSQWYNDRNPNWASRPQHMLELNTVAHAIEYVNPTATEDDEAPSGQAG